MNIDHICIAVKSISKASKKMCDLFGYHPYTEKIENTRQQVNVQFLRKDDSLEIKLIEPTNKNSPLVNFLKKGEGLHHICFKVDNMQKEILNFESAGLRVLSHPEPGEAFNGELVSFLYAGHGLNFEIVETLERAKIL